MGIRHDVLVLPLSNSLEASIKYTSRLVRFFLRMMTVVGMLVLKKILAGRPITVSIAPFFQQGLANGSFSIATEKDPVRKDDGHHTIVLF